MLVAATIDRDGMGCTQRGVRGIVNIDDGAGTYIPWRATMFMDCTVQYADTPAW